MNCDQFLLEPLNIAGAKLLFSANVQPDGIDVSAAVLAWLDMRRRTPQLIEAVYANSHIRVSEDTWYDKAQEIFNSFKTSLASSGVTPQQYAEMREDYFAHHPQQEIEAWLVDVESRRGNGSQAASCH
jgi:hypothetical protein